MAKRRGRVKRGGGWRQDNRLNSSGWSRGALAKPVARAAATVEAASAQGF
jgi:hypothetical protein